MVKVKDEPAMAEPNSATSPKPSNTSNSNSTSSYSVRKTRPHTHSHHHHHPPFQHYTFYHQCSYPSESADGSSANGTSSPARFYFGPGFEPQQQIAGGGYGPGPSQNQGNEYVVFFHVNPGVTISFQMGDNLEILRGELFSKLYKIDCTYLIVEKSWPFLGTTSLKFGAVVGFSYGHLQMTSKYGIWNLAVITASKNQGLAI